MVNSKRLLVSFLIICLTFTMVLAGCGNNSANDKEPTPSTGNSNTPSTEPAKEAEAELEPVTLKWFIMGEKREDTTMVFDHFNERLQEYLPNTKVEFELVPQPEFADRWELAAAAGEKFDLAWTGYVHDFVDQVNKGAYLPITDLFEQYGAEMREEIPNWIFDYSRVDGELYAIPSYKDMFDLRAGLRTPKALADKYWDYDKAEKVFFNRDGREWTREDYDVLEAYMEKLKAAGELKLGLSDTLFSRLSNGTALVGGKAGPYTVRENDDSFKVQLRFESPAVKLYYDVMAEWFKKGYIRKDILSNQNRRQDEGKPEGYTLWFHTSYVNQSETETKNNGFPIEVIPVEKDWRILPESASSATAIPRTAKNPERAMMLINIMNTEQGKELLNILAFGKEGVHYTKVTDSQIELPPIDTRVNPNILGFVAGNSFNVYASEPPIEGYESFSAYVKEIMENAIVSPLVGFKPDISKIDTKLAQLSAIASEYQGLQLGAIANHEKVYEEFIDKLHKAGSEEVRVELQKQVDAFLTSKGISVPAR